MQLAWESNALLIEVQGRLALPTSAIGSIIKA